MNQIKPITPESQPQFPCWLWYSCDSTWVHVEPPFKPSHHFYTHWHPDQPSAPTERPIDQRDKFQAELAAVRAALNCDLWPGESTETAARRVWHALQDMRQARDDAVEACHLMQGLPNTGDVPRAGNGPKPKE